MWLDGYTLENGSGRGDDAFRNEHGEGDVVDLRNCLPLHLVIHICATAFELSLAVMDWFNSAEGPAPESVLDNQWTRHLKLEWVAC
jgi:hypothetical protein